MEKAEKEALLAALSAHGQAFLESFDLPQPVQKKRRIEEDEEFEEWTGFGSRNSDSESGEEDEGYDGSSTDGGEEEDGDGKFNVTHLS